jgi:hypothetical protein
MRTESFLKKSPTLDYGGLAQSFPDTTETPQKHPRKTPEKTRLGKT